MSSYSNYTFLFSVLLLWHLGDLQTQRQTAPRGASCFLKMITTSQPILSLYTQLPPYLTLIHEANISLVLNHPRARYQATRDHPYSPKPSCISNKPIVNCSFCLVLPFHSFQKPQQRLWRRLSPCSFLFPDQYSCFPLWPCMVWRDPLSGTCEYNNFFTISNIYILRTLS